MTFPRMSLHYKLQSSNENTNMGSMEVFLFVVFTQYYQFFVLFILKNEKYEKLLILRNIGKKIHYRSA